MKFILWRDATVAYLRIHGEANTYTLLTEMKHRTTGKPFNSLYTPSMNQAVNVLHRDPRIIVIRRQSRYRDLVGGEQAVWALNPNHIDFQDWDLPEFDEEGEIV